MDSSAPVVTTPKVRQCSFDWFLSPGLRLPSADYAVLRRRGSTPVPPSPPGPLATDSPTVPEGALFAPQASLFGNNLRTDGRLVTGETASLRAKFSEAQDSSYSVQRFLSQKYMGLRITEFEALSLDQVKID